jgi:integrase
VTALLGVLRCLRDRAIVLLMLQGGLRPGEVLALRLEDVAYGRRRVVVRHRDDHPKAAGTARCRPGRGPAYPATRPGSAAGVTEMANDETIQAMSSRASK